MVRSFVRQIILGRNTRFTVKSLDHTLQPQDEHRKPEFLADFSTEESSQIETKLSQHDNMVNVPVFGLCCSLLCLAALYVCGVCTCLVAHFFLQLPDYGNLLGWVCFAQLIVMKVYASACLR